MDYNSAGVPLFMESTIYYRLNVGCGGSPAVYPKA